MSKLQRWKRQNWDKFDDIRFKIKAGNAMIVENKILQVRSHK